MSNTITKDEALKLAATSIIISAVVSEHAGDNEAGDNEYDLLNDVCTHKNIDIQHYVTGVAEQEHIEYLAERLKEYLGW